MMKAFEAATLSFHDVSSMHAASHSKVFIVAAVALTSTEFTSLVTARFSRKKRGGLRGCVK